MANLDITGIEHDLTAAGISVAGLCREAGISQTTWHRLKFGQRSPRESTVRVVQGALARLLPGDRKEAA
jgi:predicted transcriptional regulator